MHLELHNNLIFHMEFLQKVFPSTQILFKAAFKG